jgi:hypothetical protein
MHTETKIELVKKGEYIRFKVDGPVYVKGDYNRHTKKYEASKFEDINHYTEKKKGTKVYIGFDF